MANIQTPKAAHDKQIFQIIESDNCGPRSCDSSILFRLQTGHNGLNFQLHRIGLHPYGLCNECRSPEMVKHFLLQCPKYTNERGKLQHATDKLHIDFNLQSLLRSHAAAAHVLAYVHDTKKHSVKAWRYKTLLLYSAKNHHSDNNNNFVAGM